MLTQIIIFGGRKNTNVIVVYNTVVRIVSYCVIALHCIVL